MEISLIWAKIILGGDSKESLLKKLEDVSGVGKDMLDSPEFTVSEQPRRISLMLTSAGKLLENGASTQEIYDRAQELGWDLCPAEVGPQIQLHYPDQLRVGWLRIAMEPIEGPDCRLIFSVWRAQNGECHLFGENFDHRWPSDEWFVFYDQRD